MSARQILLDGLARDAGISGLVSELAPLHPRASAFPGEVFPHLAADALDWCGASRPGPLAVAGLRGQFLPGCTFRGRRNKEVPVRGAGRAGRQAEQVQRDVAAAARHRVQEHHGGGADGQDRDGQGPQAELALADLADDEEDEQRVDQVNVHAASVPRGPRRARHPADGSPG